MNESLARLLEELASDVATRAEEIAEPTDFFGGAGLRCVDQAKGEQAFDLLGGISEIVACADAAVLLAPERLHTQQAVRRDILIF